MLNNARTFLDFVRLASYFKLSFKFIRIKYDLNLMQVNLS